MITYELARTVVGHALAHARQQNFPPMTVAVLDAAGDLIVNHAWSNRSDKPCLVIGTMIDAIPENS